MTLAGSPLAGATAKTLAGATVSGNHVSLTFDEPEETLTAGVPYIIKWADDGSGNITEPVFEGVTITSTQGQTITPDEDVNFIGYYNAFTINNTNSDIYYMTANNTLDYYSGDVERTLYAFRAYFQFGSSVLTSAPVFTLDFGSDATTLIGSLPADLTGDGEWYTLQGLKIGKKPTTTGVYIHNGRKVIIK